MAILYVGIDLAKSVFAVHGVNEAGKAELARPMVARAKLSELIAALRPCVVGMEACTGAHHWARLFSWHRATRLETAEDAGEELPEDVPAKMHHAGQTGGRRTR